MIIIVGIAGAGKSTQGQILAAKLGCPWLSTGQLLRDHLVDSKVLKKMLSGNLLTDDVLFPLLETEFKRLGADRNELILDGTPRTMPQAHWLGDKIKSGHVKLTAVVHLVVSKKTVEKRLLSRGRPDDTIAAIQKRLAEFEQTVLPVVNYFKEQGYKVVEIDGEGPVEEDAKKIAMALNL